MSALGGVMVDLTVVLGSTRLPIRELLKLGRGASILLDRSSSAPSELHAGGRCVATGRIVLDNERVALEIADLSGGRS